MMSQDVNGKVSEKANDSRANNVNKDVRPQLWKCQACKAEDGCIAVTGPLAPVPRRCLYHDTSLLEGIEKIPKWVKR